METMQRPTNTNHRGILPANGAESARKEGLMASISTPITASAEAEVREFAREFPTLQVRRMVALCEAGRISWADAYTISQRALAAGIEAVK